MRFKRKEDALRRHCHDVGRDEREIERTLNTGPIIIRSTREEALDVLQHSYARNGGAQTWSGRAPEEQPLGSPKSSPSGCAPFVELGYRHIVVGFPAPYDEETMVRMVEEVRPLLESVAVSSA